MLKAKPVLLVVLDGWGIRAEREANAILLAGTPNLDRSRATTPRTELQTSGLAVGLPEGQMGNSEVGHTNIGAGRIVYQDLVRINRAAESGELAQNPVLRAAMDKRQGRTARRSTCWAWCLRAACTPPWSTCYALLEAARERGRAAGLRPRLPRRARHAAAERRSATWRSWSASSHETARRASPP